MARLLETDTFTNKDISAAVAIGAYTANATRLVHVRVACDQVSGNGDYTVYATLQIAGTGSSYRIIPITTAAAASGVTALMFVSGGIPMDNTDVLTVYIDGLLGDTTTPDTRVDFYEKDYLRPTVAGRTLDVSDTGEAGLDFANVKAATAPTTLTNITVPAVTTVATTSALTGYVAPPTASDNATAAAAAILATPANKLATDGSGQVVASNAQTAAAAALTAYDPPTKTELDNGFAALNDLSAADVNAEVVDVLRTDTIPDSYAADGAQPTIAQAILVIQQFLTEKAVSGTTVTVKKPDGSTAAMTFTLNDGTSPSSITRAS